MFCSSCDVCGGWAILRGTILVTFGCLRLHIVCALSIVLVFVVVVGILFVALVLIVVVVLGVVVVVFLHIACCFWCSLLLFCKLFL